MKPDYEPHPPRSAYLTLGSRLREFVCQCCRLTLPTHVATQKWCSAARCQAHRRGVIAARAKRRAQRRTR